MVSACFIFIRLFVKRTSGLKRILFYSRFKSLDVNERINALSTTFPYFLSKLIEAHNELREISLLSPFKRNILGPSLYAQASYAGSQNSNLYQYGMADSG